MKGRYGFWLAVALWLAVLVACLCVNVKANKGDEELPKIDQSAVSEPNSGRLAGDDVPAREHAWPNTDEFSEQQDYENQKIEAALLEKATRIDNVTVTYYCTEKRKHICGTGDGITASGVPVQAGISCAVDPKLIPLGATVLVDYGDGELAYLIAQDTGGAIKGKHIDVAVGSHADALQFGKRTATVYWLIEGE